MTQIELNATNQPTRRTHYVGNLEWTDRNPGGSANREARLNLPGGLILVKHFLDGKAPTTDYRYVFTDVLGSVDVIANETGTAVERMSFDVHGRRRSEINWTTPITYGFDATTRKGYTGHEQIDGAGLVHMRARMYDPRLGRFIQPDPMVESDATQGWNRYSYVLNNPMSATDPTGMLTQRQAVRAGRTIAAIVVSIALPQAGFWAGTAFEGFGAFVVGGFVSGGISGGWQGAIWGAFSAGTFQAVGAAFPGTPGVPISQAVGKTAYWHKVLAHGTAGGVLNTLQGGKFGHGFVSNGVMEAASPGIQQLDTVYAQTFTAALVGGTVSDITGGNFGNGALTSAFAWAFNHSAKSQEDESALYIAMDGAGGENKGDNFAFRQLASDLGASLYDVEPLSNKVQQATSEAIGFSEAHPGGSIYLLGYSAGGYSVTRVAANLGKSGINVKGLVTFDPRSGNNFFTAGTRGGDYGVSANVLAALNFYQRSPRQIGNNTFYGNTLRGKENILLQNSQGHSFVVSEALDGYRSRIMSTLGR